MSQKSHHIERQAKGDLHEHVEHNVRPTSVHQLEIKNPVQVKRKKQNPSSKNLCKKMIKKDTIDAESKGKQILFLR